MLGLSNEHRKNTRFVEREFQATLDTLQQEKVRKVMGQKAVELETLATQVFVPPVARDGKITIPSEYKDTDYIPVLPARPGQHFYLSADFTHFTPRQRVSAMRRVSGYPSAPKEIVDSIEQGFDPNLAVPVQKPASHANVTYRAIGSEGNEALQRFEGPSGLYVMMRPIVFLGRRALLPPSVIAHELIHVDQILNADAIMNRDNPFFSDGAVRSRELEAYHWGAKIEEYEDTANDVQRRIEAARLGLADINDPFAASPELVAHIAKAGVKLE